MAIKFNVDYREVKGQRVIYLLFETDLTYDHLDHFNTTLEELVREDSSAVVIDLSKIDFLDSSGAAILTKMQKDMRKADKILIMEGIRPRPRKVLEFLRLDTEFNLTANPAESKMLLERNI